MRSGSKAKVRFERDSLGEMPVPVEALYGASTARAMQNFPVSSLRTDPVLLVAVLQIKQAAAAANLKLGQFDKAAIVRPGSFGGHSPQAAAAAIQRAAADIAADLQAGSARFGSQFPVDVFQAGAGTSLNMNVNEVVANHAAATYLGGRMGDRSLIDPNDHVNMGQSTNDVIPTAMRLCALALVGPLAEAVERLAGALHSRARAFWPTLKSGRTHLQDAVPIRLGQEFGAWARTVLRALPRMESACDELRELGIGGNAVGTGLNTPPGFREAVVGELSAITGERVRAADDPIELCQNTDSFVQLSAALRSLALDLSRICNDLRLLASGPNTGFAEISLPAVQPGSSIMPGKVNPVMAEMLNMVCCQVIGNDQVVALACQAGQLELNVMMPVMAHNLNQSLHILTSAVGLFADRCIAGISADTDRCRRYLDSSMGLATLLNPRIGYLRAADVVKRAEREHRTIREVVVEEKLMTAADFDRMVEEAVGE